MIETGVGVGQWDPTVYILGTREFPWHRFITLELWSYDPQTKRDKEKIPVEFTHLSSKDIVFFDDRGFQILEEGHGFAAYWSLPDLEEGVYRIAMLFDNRNAKELPPEVWRGRISAHRTFGVKEIETPYEQASMYTILAGQLWFEEKYEKAWEMYQKVLKTDPSFTRVYAALTKLAIKFGRYEEALAYYEEYKKYHKPSSRLRGRIREVKRKRGLLPPVE